MHSDCLCSSGNRYPLEQINMIYQRFLFHLTPIIYHWNPLSSMHRANLTIITIPVLLLAATVAISVMVSEDAFARDSTSQAAAVDNTCLNPIFDSNDHIDNAIGVGNCGGTISQQDESGQASAPITSQTANPTLELQRLTTTSQPAPTTCEECFDLLNDAQQSTFEEEIPTRFQTIFPGQYSSSHPLLLQF
jgi:hypothetical protein